MRTLLAALVVAAALPAAAQQLVLTHHARLLDAADRPLTAQGVKVRFRFYKDLNPPASSESAIWDSGECSVDVVGGSFAVTFGDGCGTNLTGAHFPALEPRYLEVTVDTTVLRPRLRFGMVPNAAEAQNAALLSGKSLADLDGRYARLATGAETQSGDLRLSGVVTAGAFSGDGAELTNLKAASVTGKLTDEQLESGSLFARLDRDAAFAANVRAAALHAGTILSEGALSAEGAITGGGDVTAAGALKGASVSATGAISGASIGATGDVTAGGKFRGDGSQLTNLSAAAIAGKFDAAQLPTNLALLDATQTITGATTFASGTLRLATGPGDCSPARAGALRFLSGGIEICNGTGWLRLAATPQDVAWWKFDETSGSIAYDTYTSGANGTLGTGTSWLPASECKVGGCIRFDGTMDGYMSVPASVLDGLGDFTIAYWAKSTSGKANSWAFNALVTGNDNYFLIAGQTETTWSRWVLRRNAAGVVLFRDGVPAPTFLAGPMAAAESPRPTRTSGGTLFLAQDQDCPGGCLDASQAFQGALDDVKILGYAVSDAVVAAGVP